MSIFDYFIAARSPRNQADTAAIAKERLQIIVAHERGRNPNSEKLRALQQDLLQVIARYFPIDPEQVKVELDKNGECSILELNITLPTAAEEAITA